MTIYPPITKHGNGKFPGSFLPKLRMFYCHVRLPEGMWCHFCTWEPRVTTYLNSIVAGSGAPVECRYIQIPSIDFLKLLPCLKQSQVTAGLGSTVGSSPSYGFKLWSSSCTWRSEAEGLLNPTRIRSLKLQDFTGICYGTYGSKPSKP